ncbi:mating type protein MAT-2, partial [Gaertneriomyces semiglobifer]
MQKPRKAPRPANSFILYRREKQDFVMKTHDGITNNEASRIIGEMWAKEPDEVKAVYKQKAEEAKRLHMAAYPDYKYAPRKPNKNKKQSSEPSASNNLNQT